MSSAEPEHKYGTMVTPAGKAVIAAAIANGAKVDIASVAIGDGGGEAYTVQPGQADIRNQVFEDKPNAVYVDPKRPNYVVVELYVPETVGGWTIREIAVKTASGVVLAVGCVPAVYKPIMPEGSAIGGLYRFIMKIADAAVINLIVDPSTVMATIEYVDGQISMLHIDLDKHIKDTHPHDGAYEKTPERLMWRNKDGRSQVADPVEPHDATNKRTTEKIIDGKFADTEIETELPLTGGGALSGNLKLGVNPATAEALGVVELATLAEAIAGEDAERVVTPATLLAALEQIGLLMRGEIRLLPFVHDDLPFGWYFCNGERFASTTRPAAVLRQLSPAFQNYWKITTTSAGTNVPLLLDPDGKGYFFRGVSGDRLPGSVEQDAARAIMATANSSASSGGNVTAKGTFGNITVKPGPETTGVFSYTYLGLVTWGDGINGGDTYYRYSMNINSPVPAPSVSTNVTIQQQNVDTENRQPTSA